MFLLPHETASCTRFLIFSCQLFTGDSKDARTNRWWCAVPSCTLSTDGISQIFVNRLKVTLQQID